MKSLIVLLAAVSLLSACTGTDQDPLKGSSDVVRNGRPPDAQKPSGEPAYGKNTLYIDSPSSVNGRVGTPVEFQISGRVALEGVTHRISVDNLRDFPGATFDQAKGLFSWVPGRDTVGSTPSVELVLRVSLVTDPNSEYPVRASEIKNIVLVIVNNYTKPVINYVNGPAEAVAGARTNFDFEVEDQDALAGVEVKMTKGDCLAYNMDSLTHFLEFPTTLQPGSSPGKYRGTLVLNLSTGVDTLVTGRYCFTVAAKSKFGVVSEDYLKEVYVEARVKNTKITNPIATIPAGQVMSFGFSVFDPSGAGIVSIKSIGDLSAMIPGSNITCGSSVNGSVDCVAFIDATNAQPSEHTVQITTENKSARTTQTTTTNHVLRVVVKAH